MSTHVSEYPPIYAANPEYISQRHDATMESLRDRSRPVPMQELFEVWIVPHNAETREVLDLKFNTFEFSPEAAIEKVKRYLIERNHVAHRMKADFVVHKRPLIE